MRRSGAMAKRSSSAAARCPATSASPRCTQGLEGRLERAGGRVEPGLLGQIGDRSARSLEALAGIQLDQACERLEQGRLAGAVAADQADAIGRRDRHGQRREQRLGAEADGGVAQREQGRGHGTDRQQDRGATAAAPRRSISRVARWNGGLARRSARLTTGRRAARRRQVVVCTRISTRRLSWRPASRAVVGARLELAATDGAQAAGRDAEHRQLLAHRHGPPLREQLIVAVGTDRVGVADDRDLVAVVFLAAPRPACTWSA